jgi:hypothetical protein
MAQHDAISITAVGVMLRYFFDRLILSIAVVTPTKERQKVTRMRRRQSMRVRTTSRAQQRVVGPKNPVWWRILCVPFYIEGCDDVADLGLVKHPRIIASC